MAYRAIYHRRDVSLRAPHFFLSVSTGMITDNLVSELTRQVARASVVTFYALLE